jgi:hypothetical protein
VACNFPQRHLRFVIDAGSVAAIMGTLLLSLPLSIMLLWLWLRLRLRLRLLILLDCCCFD